MHTQEFLFTHHLDALLTTKNRCHNNGTINRIFTQYFHWRTGHLNLFWGSKGVKLRWRVSGMIKPTMNASKVRFASKTFSVLLLLVCVLVLSEVSASLLDPTQIGRELQTFARDALGVDEMQARTIENVILLSQSAWYQSNLLVLLGWVRDM